MKTPLRHVAYRIMFLACVLLVGGVLSQSSGSDPASASQHQWKTYGSGVFRTINDGGDMVPLYVDSVGVVTPVGVNLIDGPWPTRLTIPASVNGAVANRVAFSQFASWADNFPPGVKLAWIEIVYSDGSRYGDINTTPFVVQGNTAEWAYERLDRTNCMRHTGAEPPLKHSYDFTSVDHSPGNPFTGHYFYAAFDIPERRIDHIEVVANTAAFSQKQNLPCTSFDARNLFNLNVTGVSLRVKLGSISGSKYEDLDGDGSRDAGEPGLPGWQFCLSGQSSACGTTDGSGGLLFDGLSDGNYSVCEVAQTGWLPSVPSNGCRSITISDASDSANNDFGNYRYASVAGEKYDDLNGNRTRDGGEPGLSGWDIHLVGTDGLGNPVNRTQTTVAGGSYMFSNVVPGSYTVSETLKNDEDWVQTQPSSTTYAIQPQSGQNLTGLAFGNLVRAEVHGSKFEDMNEDGDRDPEDVGLGGWQIRLSGTDGMNNAVNRTTNTAADGTYAFLQIVPGTYTVCETNPDPLIWYQTRPAPLPDGKCYSFVLQSHSVENDVDFENYERSTIEGIKFSDEHKDGTNNNGDYGLPNWEITLTDCSGVPIPQAAGGVPTQPGQTSDPNPQMTDANGYYRFGGLHNRCYRIAETPQLPEWVQTKPCLDPAGSCGYQINEMLSGSTEVRDFGNFEQPVIAKVPEGNEYNVDLAVPKANLWICETGPCSGPGEGNLIVFERVRNVHTGDQNGDFIEDGLGAYEFTVEYDNFVIQSVNPCDIVFGAGGAGSSRGLVDELDSSDNPYCSPDPNGANNGTCAMSLILENLVHFGCVTYGQLPGPTGDFDVAALNLIPHPDLKNDIFPGNNNGVLTVLKDNGCELVDTFGHPIIGSINGGLTPLCRDLAVTVRILEGDLDLDCDVDLTDSQLISYRYGGFFGGLLYSKWYDLEPELHDLDIDIKDVQKVFGRDGSTCQVPVPDQLPLDPPTPFEPSTPLSSTPTAVPTASASPPSTSVAVTRTVSPPSTAVASPTAAP